MYRVRHCERNAAVHRKEPHSELWIAAAFGLAMTQRLSPNLEISIEPEP